MLVVRWIRSVWLLYSAWFLFGCYLGVWFDLCWGMLYCRFVLVYDSWFGCWVFDFVFVILCNRVGSFAWFCLDSLLCLLFIDSWYLFLADDLGIYCGYLIELVLVLIVAIAWLDLFIFIVTGCFAGLASFDLSFGCWIWLLRYFVCGYCCLLICYKFIGYGYLTLSEGCAWMVVLVILNWLVVDRVFCCGVVYYWFVCYCLNAFGVACDWKFVL